MKNLLLSFYAWLRYKLSFIGIKCDGCGDKRNINSLDKCGKKWLCCICALKHWSEKL